jgi:hypothetical protein
MCSERHLSSAAAWAAVDSVRPDWLCRAAGMTTVFEAVAVATVA